ncbi:hypothetical protein CICLE_v10013881mg, partial [Citrus x clementina]
RDKVYKPVVIPHDHMPRLGQEFVLLDDVHEFYNEYAKKVGFSVRINSSRKSHRGEIVRKEYVCSKEGATTKEVVEKKRRCSKVREGCKAKLAVVKSKSGTYVVSVFEEDHNHPLTTPRRVHLLRSHRNVSEVKRSLTHQLAAANIPIHQQISVLELQGGGIQNIGCLGKDLYNDETKSKNKVKGHDADMLLEHFQLEKEKNSAFTFTIESDNENRITHCFWADATSRRGYNSFGDVVVFDTTYNTNKYGMIFAPFIGVNNHGQTTVFACSFLSDETTESFVWLFEQFKKAMPGDLPKMIITDQDPAITKAISETLPNTFHRDDFDRNWLEIIEKGKLRDNAWLKSVFEIRSKWVPAYVNHVFSAGMSSSQRAESYHFFFKRYVSKKNSLLDFMIRFNRALNHQRHEELNANHADINEKPTLKLPLKMEKQMVSLYTREIFYKFQDELWDSLQHKIELVKEDAHHCVYKVVNQNEDDDVHEVLFDKTLDFASCICKKFESKGIPCKHILAYFHRKQFTYLPDQYILKRWTKSARCDKVIGDGGLEIEDCFQNSILMRRTALFQLASNVIDKAVISEEASKILMDDFENSLRKIKSVVSQDPKAMEKNKCTDQHVLNDPLVVRAKGCGKRLKKRKEKARAKDKNRRCHGCGKIGQSHDKRNCPMLKNR